MSKKLTGKIALVTGGSSGLGLAAAQLFADEGARVFMTGRRQAELDAALPLIGGDPVGVQGDISKLADLDRLYEIIRQKAGRLDVLFANAGGGAFAPLGEITEAHFDKYFGINVKGTLFTVLRAEFDQLYEEASRRRRMMSISTHDRISGTPARVRLLGEFIDYAKSHPGVAFLRKDQIAHWTMSQKDTPREG